ncbi:MAG: ribosome silencing factor [Thermodesulfobacteriota bacterium]
MICTSESNIESIDKAILIANSVIDKKGEDPVIIEVKKESDVADYFVVCNAASDRGVKTIADNIEKILKENNINIFGIEGTIKRNWILIDTSDVITHIFYKPLREFYDIEGLYIDSPRIDIDLSGELKDSSSIKK